MPTRKKDTIIAICIQEPTEDGSSMDFGPIKGDDLRFLHQAFITDTIYNALLTSSVDVRLFFIDQSSRRRLVDIVVGYLKKKLTGPAASALKNRFSIVPQEKNRWGIRIDQIFSDCFKEGYKHVLVVGSRTPTVTSVMMQAALKMLDQSDAVFGPTPEGRYYIIGMTGEYRISLAEFDWKSPSIYSQVTGALTEKKLRWSELEIWYCVESPEELEMMARDINQYRFEGDTQSAAETEIVMERILTRLEP
jgi:hypothetical protein